MSRILAFVSLLVGMFLMGGCEWEGVKDAESWNDKYSWVNFNGVYRNPQGGVLVTQFEVTPGSDPVVKNVDDELVGVGLGDPVQTYNGRIRNTPIVAGSLQLRFGSMFYNDNSDGTLIGTIGSGTVMYTTGVWSVDLKAILGKDVPISATYSYVAKGSAGKVEPGSTGTAIYSITVEQLGNSLTFIDSDGASYSGKLELLSGTGGEGGVKVNGTVVSTFTVSGKSRAGMSVTISGTLQGDYVSTTTTTGGTGGTGTTGTGTPETHTTMKTRTLTATWIEKDAAGNTIATGDISGAVSVPPGVT